VVAVDGIVSGWSLDRGHRLRQTLYATANEESSFDPLREFFRPFGAWSPDFFPNGLRRGLHSVAASRLEIPGRPSASSSMVNVKMLL